MTGKPSFLAELKRRNVLRAATLYAAGAWLLVQVITQVGPVFNLPSSTQRWAIVALVIGFPFAMLFAWYFEWTPEGFRREGELQADVPEVRASNKGFDRLIIAVLAMAVVLLLANTIVRRPVAAAAPSMTAPERSIAVLPFESRSEERANAYFADGIQDEILTRLSKIGTLKVISRRSTLRYASHPDNLPLIARQLGVANVLEGSVQKAGDSVRINVQLIQANGDSHLWAETYDRKLDNVFGVESEVAEAIARTLDAKLSGAEKTELARKPTTNHDAYDAYLHGLSLWDRPDLAATDELEAVRAFEDAVRLDPGFAVAWARLSTVHASLFFTNVDRSAARRDAARSTLAQAIRLQSGAFETRLAQAYQAYFVERDYDGARTLFEEVRKLAPSNSEIPVALALIARRQARWDDSIRSFDEAIELDPRNPKVLLWASDTRIYTRQFRAALQLLDRVLAVVPADSGAVSREVLIHQARGELDIADEIISRMQFAKGDEDLVAAKANQLRLRHRYGDGADWLRSMLVGFDASDRLDRMQSLFLLADMQRLSGDAAGSKMTYGQCIDILNALTREQPGNAPLLNGLALAWAGMGDRDAASATARSALAKLPASQDAVSGPNGEETLARIQARFGDKDAAIAGLQHLLEIPYEGLYGVPLTPALLRTDPDFDGLRDDPRFRTLAAVSIAAPMQAAPR